MLSTNTKLTALFLIAMTLSAADATLPELQQMMAKFAAVDLKVDTGHLSTGDRAALAKLVEASRIVDRIFLRQMWAGNPALYEKLKQDTTPLGKARLDAFWLYKGPFSDLDEHKAFLPGVPARKPLGAGFYPEDMNKKQFETWSATLTPAARAEAEGFFTVIERGPGNTLKAVQYSEAYKKDLADCARLFREAATLTGNLAENDFYRRARRRSFQATTITAAISRGWIWMRRSTSLAWTVLRDIQRRNIRLQGRVRIVCQYSARAMPKRRTENSSRRPHAGGRE